MKTAKIVITEFIGKKTGITSTKIEVRAGKRGKGVPLFTVATSLQHWDTWKRYHDKEMITFVHSPLTLALKKCYRFCVKNKIRLV